MKLVTIDGREVAGRPGVLLDSNQVLDLSAAPSTLSESQWIPYSVVSILAAGESGAENVNRLLQALDSIDAAEKAALAEQHVLVPLAEASLMSPLRRPGLMLISLSATTGEALRNRVFIKSPNSAAGNNATVRLPKSQRSQIVATPLLAAILGRPLHEASEQEAEEAIAAYTLIIEFETVDLDADTGAGWRGYVESKQFPESCPMGPAMVTVDELPDPAHIQAAVSINGVATANGPLLHSSISPAAVVADLSSRYGFSTGDLVAFGTRVIDDSSQEVPLRVAVQPGDELSVELPGIMSLSSHLAV